MTVLDSIEAGLCQLLTYIKSLHF